MKAQLKVTLMGDISMMKYAGRIDAAYAELALREVKPILGYADIRIANLENAITEPTMPIAKTGPNIWQTKGDLAFLKEAKVDCAILANNHVGDFDEAGVANTIRVLDREGFGHAGAGRNIDAAYEPWYKKTEAGTLAVCAFCEYEFGCATLDKWGVAGLDLERVARSIRQAREHADFVLVYMHGGNEYNPLPSPKARARYRLFVELGADAVIGVHTHCMQGMEVYRDTPIVYSMGNFFFPAQSGKERTSGYMVELTFEKGQKPMYQLHPYRLNEEKTVIHLLTGTQRKATLAYLEKISGIIKDERLLQAYFDGWSMIMEPELMSFNYKKEYLEAHDIKHGHPMLVIRNIRTCEAHNEVVTNLTRIIVEDRVAAAREMMPLVCKLQEVPE